MGEQFVVRAGPPSVRLLGRAGVGKSVLSAGLVDRGLSVSDGPSDAVLYCFAGGLRETDRRAIDALSAGVVPLVVVWTKADVAGSWRAADDYAAALTEVLGRTVVAVMAILDSVDDADVATLRAIAESGVALPESATDAAATLGDDAELLLRLGGYGVACAVGGLRSETEMADSELVARLRELSGIDALIPLLTEAFTGCGARRERELDAELRRVANAECIRRDEAEQVLLDRLRVMS